jgi:hypothetical protein
MHPDVMDWDEDGNRKPLIDLLAVPHWIRGTLGPCLQGRRWSCSGSLGASERAKAADGRMALLSALGDCRWSWIAKGWELQERIDREKEVAQRSADMAFVEEQNPLSDDPIEMQRREAARAKLKDSWPDDPHDRRRSWKGWW